MSKADSSPTGRLAAGSCSRRRFLGGSVAAAVGGLSGGLGSTIVRAQSTAPTVPAGLDYLHPAGAVDEAYWAKVRKQFNLVDDLTYMNNGTLGPMPRYVFDANVRYLRDIMEDPRRGGMADDVRQKVAGFVGANADEIALNRSTTEGVKMFCWGANMKEGDEVLMSTHEHPGGYGPWRARERRYGIKVTTVDIPAPPDSADQIVSLFEKAITPKTRVLFTSHIVFVTGLVMPIKALAELAHRRGLLISVDGAHAPGMLDLNFHDLGVDHYSGAGQKWLLAGTGTGLAYFKREIQDQIASDIWFEDEKPDMFARKYERSGQRDIPSALGMGDAVDFHNAIGKATVEARVRQLATRFRTGLKDIPGVRLGTSMTAELNGGLTTFYIPGVPKETTTRVLMEREQIFIPGSRLNANACRLSTHIYNTPAEVDRAIETIRHIATNASKYTNTAA